MSDPMLELCLLLPRLEALGLDIEAVATRKALFDEEASAASGVATFKPGKMMTVNVSISGTIEA